MSEQALEEPSVNGSFGDFLLSGLAVFGGVWIFTYSQTLPNPPGAAYGPGLFPGLLGALTTLIGIALGIFAVLRRLRKRSENMPESPVAEAASAGNEVAEAVQPQLEDDSSGTGTWGAMRRWSNVVVALVAVAFYMLFSQSLGFIITVATIQIVLMVKFGHKVLWSLVIGAISTLLLYWTFDRVLMIRLPSGILG